MNLRSYADIGLPRVYHLHMEDRWDLAMTFVRMQEWYESPKFYHTDFSLEDFMRWYAKKYGKGTFSYPKDWSGFNVSSDAVVAIANLEEHGTMGWSAAECDLFEYLCENGILTPPDPIRKGKTWDQFLADPPFYLIGTSDDGDPDDIDHELAHGRYFTDEHYRKEVNRVLKHHDTSRMTAWLLKKGYGKWSVKDETHAYALTGWPDNFKPGKKLKAFKRELQRAVA